MCVTSSNKGFTLIEMLIAVVLLGILSAALYGSYFTVLRARERSSEGMEARRELGSTLDLIRREFAGAIYNREDKRLRFVVEDRDNFGKPCLQPGIDNPDPLLRGRGAKNRVSALSAIVWLKRINASF